MLGEEFGKFSTICYSFLELSLGGLILITCSAGAGGFLKAFKALCDNK